MLLIDPRLTCCVLACDRRKLIDGCLALRQLLRAKISDTVRSSALTMSVLWNFEKCMSATKRPKDLDQACEHELCPQRGSEGKSYRSEDKPFPAWTFRLAYNNPIVLLAFLAGMYGFVQSSSLICARAHRSETGKHVSGNLGAECWSKIVIDMLLSLTNLAPYPVL